MNGPDSTCCFPRRSSQLPPTPFFYTPSDIPPRARHLLSTDKQYFIHPSQRSHPCIVDRHPRTKFVLNKYNRANSSNGMHPTSTTLYASKSSSQLSGTWLAPFSLWSTCPCRDPLSTLPRSASGMTYGRFVFFRTLNAEFLGLHIAKHRSCWC